MAADIYTYDSLDVAVGQLRYEHPTASLVATLDSPEYLTFYEADNAGAPIGPALARVPVNGS